MKFRRPAPPPAEARADAAAEQAGMARGDAADGDEGAASFRRHKAVRAAKGLRIRPRDEPDSDRD
ncbi:hypothetical protein ACFC26_09800 [Kitasatospora purpeofusca]|uniref:hypothetical protein n=1 Tax=Kitasatospora purpeofusca TaxID=67352 RepID=UPI0035E09FA5